MKTTKIILGLALVAIFSLTSCSKDSNSSDTSLTSADVLTSRKIDQASDDVSSVVEEQEANTYVDVTAGKTADLANSMLSDCAHVTRVPDFGTAPTVGQTVTKTIDFSFNNPAGCTLANGTVLKGKIIISFVYDPSATSHTINYSFDNFYHNGNLVSNTSTRTVTRTMAGSTLLTAVHPIHTMDIDMTVTMAASGGVYHRVGTRTRECVAGFGLPINSDARVYKVYGNMTTTRPDGGTQSNVILVATPLTFKNNCQYKLVSGIITITRPNHTAVLDYGNGDCDANYTIAIDGGTPVAHTFGN